MKHLRLQALIKLCELLQSETGMPVFRGRQVIGTDILLPCLNITETIRAGDTTTTSNKSIRRDRCDFLMVGYTNADDAEHPIDISYQYVGLIEQAFSKINSYNLRTGEPLYPEWFNLGGLITDFKYETPVCHNPADDVQSKAYFYFYFYFIIAYSSANPFTILDKANF